MSTKSASCSRFDTHRALFGLLVARGDCDRLFDAHNEPRITQHRLGDLMSNSIVRCDTDSDIITKKQHRERERGEGGGKIQHEMWLLLRLVKDIRIFDRRQTTATTITRIFMIICYAAIAKNTRRCCCCRCQRTQKVKTVAVCDDALISREWKKIWHSTDVQNKIISICAFSQEIRVPLARNKLSQSLLYACIRSISSLFSELYRANRKKRDTRFSKARYGWK